MIIIKPSGIATNVIPNFTFMASLLISFYNGTYLEISVYEPGIQFLKKLFPICFDELAV